MKGEYLKLKRLHPVKRMRKIYMKEMLLATGIQ